MTRATRTAPAGLAPAGLALAGLALALGGGACAQDFEPYSRLSSLRVLAVRSQPAAPAAGETTTLDALVYTPPGVEVTGRQWSWCPFPGTASDGYPCLVTEDDLAALGDGAATVPPFELGDGETAQLENSIDPALLAAICAGTPGQPELLDCAGGFPVQVELVVRTADAELTAVRQLRLRFDDAQEANANPELDGIVAMVDGEEVPLGDAPGPTLPRRAQTVVKADVPAASSETFMGTDDDGQPGPEHERLIVSWFVESGDLDSDRTAYIEGLVDLDAALENSWEPDDVDAYPRDTSDLYVVVRDNRDGVAWRRGTATLGAQP